MICPSCNSALADDLRFCLHCGRYVGKPEEATQVLHPLPPTIASPSPYPLSQWPQGERQHPVNVRVKGISNKTGAVLIVLAVLDYSVLSWPFADENANRTLIRCLEKTIGKWKTRSWLSWRRGAIFVTRLLT